jgi:hypothetical protein
VIIMLAGLVLAVLAAMSTGGDLRRLERVSIRHVWLFVVAVLIQIALFAPGQVNRFVGGWVQWLYVLSMSLVLLGLAMNFRVRGIPLATLGVGLNLAAIVANGGFMPASLDAARRSGLLPSFTRIATIGPGSLASNNNIISRGARLGFLGDIWVAPAGPLSTYFSIGDVLLAAGIAWLVLSYTRRGPDDQGGSR